ncbi:MFS transporter [Rubrobacter indicoceani]|uniref:MFS transporter n=1 Tax=Rubrobacter indicoceani TaxID=2051957 RepID=UPI000E5A1DBF|nr:MFS transporter [Rubrobacter indicoceani]
MPERKGDRSSRLLLFVMMLALFVSVVNQTMVNVAVPPIRQDFGSSEAAVGWVNTGYLLVFALCVPIYGRLSDVMQTRKILLAGLVVFGVGSLACALAPTLPTLVAGRAVQAAGAGTIPALAFGLVARTIPAGSRGPALGLLSATIGAGAAFGPVVGGFLIGAGSWHTLFYFTLALVGVALVGVALALPKEAVPDLSRSLDLTSGALLGVSVALVLFGVTEAGNVGPFSWRVGIAAAFSVGGLALFFRRINRVPEPFVSPKLIGNPGFIAACVAGFTGQFANVSGLFILPLYLTGELGRSELLVGLVLLPGAVVVALFSPLAGRLSDRAGLRPVLVAGLLVLLSGLVFMSTFGVSGSVWLAALGMSLPGFGFAATNSTASNAASASLTPDTAGVGLGIYQMCFFLGAGFAPALFGAFLTFRRNFDAGAINPVYSGDGAAYSDAFLLAGIGAIIALAAALTLPGRNSRAKNG